MRRVLTPSGRVVGEDCGPFDFHRMAPVAANGEDLAIVVRYATGGECEVSELAWCPKCGALMLYGAELPDGPKGTDGR
jgi:hypothetical protein